jgi:2-C-methyl-D-erythritol 4-phosphate cytidylyltransferase/2-C-methyl-D-erythritol 2,4-cyclodiphosphate synthase
VICEEPKLAQYRPQIVALLEGVTSARISVKATTNESMGWIGRGEGIAAIAVASVDLS